MNNLCNKAVYKQVKSNVLFMWNFFARKKQSWSPNLQYLNYCMMPWTSPVCGLWSLSLLEGHTLLLCFSTLGFILIFLFGRPRTFLCWLQQIFLFCFLLFSTEILRRKQNSAHLISSSFDLPWMEYNLNRDEIWSQSSKDQRKNSEIALFQSCVKHDSMQAGLCRMRFVWWEKFALLAGLHACFLSITLIHC